MKLEVRKYYKTRDGRKVGPMFFFADERWGVNTLKHQINQLKE